MRFERFDALSAARPRPARRGTSRSGSTPDLVRPNTLGPGLARAARSGFGAEAHVRTASTVADVEGPAVEASEGRLEAGAPNPFVYSTRLDFSLPRSGLVGLAVFDVTGRRVRVLASGAYEAGRHSVAWDGCSDAGERLGAGVYLARLEFGGRSTTRKIHLGR